jgi:hypothetical protein
MKGDRVEIVVDAGDANKTYEVAATRAGRRVEVVNRRGMIEVSELTRGGAPVRTARFMASRVIALVEHPAPRRPAAVPAPRPATGAPQRTAASSGRRSTATNAADAARRA